MRMVTFRNGNGLNAWKAQLEIGWTGDGLSICKWEPALGDMDRIKGVAEKIKEAI